MSSCVENVIRGDDEVVEVSDDLGDKIVKVVEVPHKVTPCLDHHLHFHRG